MIKLTTPLTYDKIKDLRAGDSVTITGTIYTGRDAAHKRMCAALDEGKPLPFDIDGAVIYYVGPCPCADDKVIGSCGPTTSYRMDAYAPRLIRMGLRGRRKRLLRFRLRSRSAILRRHWVFRRRLLSKSCLNSA